MIHVIQTYAFLMKLILSVFLIYESTLQGDFIDVINYL